MQEIKDQKKSKFDYSLVSNEDADFLKQRINKIQNILQSDATKVGEQFYLAQQRLATYGHGTFGSWIESLKISKDSVYRYINRYSFIANCDNQSDIETFESLQKSLTYDVSKPSAPREAVQKVLDGDITTHKEYKELEKKLKQSEEANKTLDGLLSEKADTISALEQQVKNKPKPEVVEKEVEVEKVPDDYDYIKGAFENIKGTNEMYKEQNEELRRELKSYSNQPNVDNSELLAKKEKLEAEISTLENVSGLGEEINDFINRVSSYEYQIDMRKLASKRDVLKSIHEAIDGLKKWCSDFENELPTQNFIEGEINHE